MSVLFKSTIHHLEHLAGTRYLLVPNEIVEKLGGSFSVRLWCTVNEKVKWQCGLVALGTGDAYISINAQRIKQLKAKEGESLTVALEIDDSEYGLEVPEELKELLDQDDEGNRRFNLLVAGKRRFIIRHITAVKSSQLRIERAVTLIENLKRLPAGKESFKEILGK
ncbi:YdeI/OmpD-associated family protein [Dyadobacter frigoris]|uniref:DUF1905 domain-containing protein n=1 Tax=Dyadobacter frigoris TaxID=2576211 RepID=A0A4U6D986_9BACT|nr:DUF1905 domain-containing protein [Dyadobacter frigoris]TKT92941.1 DUF1905 domain-containing protein [Dyadobacter frigoris]GLU54273.1 hypothetical protein Dfri01_37340 [Dyadobacter frigoris]